VRGSRHVEAERECLRVADLVRERHGLLTPGDSLVVVAVQHAHVRLGAVCVDELRAGRQPLEDRNRPEARALGLRVQAEVDVRHRQPPQVRRLAELIAELAVEADGVVPRPNRLLVAAGEVRLLGIRSQHGRPLGRGQPGASAKRACVLCRGLAVRSRLDCALRGSRSMLEHGGGVAGLFGVVGEPRRIRVAGRLEGREDPRMKLAPPLRRDRALHGEARELVPEGDGIPREREHPRAEALVHAVDLARRDRLEQPELRPRRDERRSVEEPSGNRA
jgi:hypothetical protein